MEWLTEHIEMLSLLANVGMLAVWIAYLHVFLANYKRQTQPKILINVGAGRSIDGRCLLSNMSSEAIYIESLIATLEADGENWVCPVTDVWDLAEEQENLDPRQMTVQGPLRQGEVMDIGSFRELIRRAVRESDCPIEAEQDFPRGLTAIRLQVIADFGPDDLLVGATRRFELAKEDDKWVLGAHTPHTEQIRSRQERREIKRRLEQVDP